MSEAKKTLEERIQEKAKKQQELQEKAKQIQAQLRKLEQQKKTADRKKRTHRLIEIGGAVESVLGRELEDFEITPFIAFMKTQEKWLNQALAKYAMEHQNTFPEE